MADPSRNQAANEYWGREGLAQAMLEGLAAAGKDLDALTIDDTAPGVPPLALLAERLRAVAILTASF